MSDIVDARTRAADAPHLEEQHMSGTQSPGGPPGDDDPAGGGTAGGGAATKSQPAVVKAYLSAIAAGDAKKALSLAAVEPLNKTWSPPRHATRGYGRRGTRRTLVERP